MNHWKSILGVILMITLVSTIMVATTSIVLQQANAVTRPIARAKDAPIASSGDNVYITWWTNKTGNNEVMFRASTDNGATFGDKIKLSNSTVNSERAEIGTSGNNVFVTWWQTTNGKDVPMLRVSTDNGKTFGPILNLSTNGTIGSSG
jgi:hypothetical protein